MTQLESLGEALLDFNNREDLAIPAGSPAL
jgi:hypothetical protein